MKLYLGLTDNSGPNQTRIFGEVDDTFVDLSLAYAAYLSRVHGDRTTAYDLAALYLPATILQFLERGEAALRALEEVVSFLQPSGMRALRGPSGEKLAYDKNEIRILPPLRDFHKTIVIGFSDQARVEALPKDAIATGFCKLPSTMVSLGESIVRPRFSEIIDGDACLALVIGKPAKRIKPAQAWNHIAGFTLLLDITARDINQREGLTKNNLLGKNFPTSMALGPALLLKTAPHDLKDIEITLSIDGLARQKFRPQECIFPVEEIVARWSRVGLYPGDTLAIGASMALQDGRLLSPVPLAPGSSVRCFSAAIGELSHRVVSSQGEQA